MSTSRRVELTVAAAVLLGVATVVNELPTWPTVAVNDATVLPLGIAAAIALFAMPLIVARWWVVSAIAGPLLALLVMQASGAAVSLDDGTGPALNYRTIFFLLIAGTILLLLGSLRSMFDEGSGGRADSDADDQLDQPG